MDFNRRGFLKALIAGASVAAAAAVAGPAFAATPNRYHELVKRQQVLMGFQRQKQRVGIHNYEHYSKAKDGIDRNMSALLDLLNDKFNGKEELAGPKKEELYQKVSQIFNRELVIDTLSEAELMRYENTLIAIATMRFLLAHQRITFDPGKCKGWNAFSDAYCDVIIRA